MVKTSKFKLLKVDPAMIVADAIVEEVVAAVATEVETEVVVAEQEEVAAEQEEAQVEILVLVLEAERERLRLQKEAQLEILVDQDVKDLRPMATESHFEDKLNRNNLNYK